MSDADAVVYSSPDRDPVEELAEEFLRRRRQGEAVSIGEYSESHPHLAERIRELFPALLLMEELKPPSVHSHASNPLTPSRGGGTIQRLGDFHILREIGRGGMGVVYEAEQESLGRRVALKVLPANCLASPTRLQRFQREAQAAARLHHTNIVPIFGVGQQDGIHYYVMQLIAGQGLDQVLSALSVQTTSPGTASHGDSTRPLPSDEPRGTFSATEAARMLLAGNSTSGIAQAADGGLPPEVARPSSATGPAPHGYWRRVARIGAQVADALEYAHRQGTLHRDIKPANLLLDNGGTMWIADFGLAKLAGHEDLTHSGDVIGTLRYMAPEQFQGKSDARSDVYSLGLTLYELLTLRPAFDEKDRRRLIRQVTQEEPPRPRKLNPAIPRDLETIVVKSIACDAGHRYATAGELAADLRCFLEDRPIRARRIPLVGRLWRWCRRNRAVAALAGTALALLAAVAVVASVGYLRTNQALERAEAERTRTKAQRERAEANLHLATKAFEDIFSKVAVDPVATLPEEDSDEEWPEPVWKTPVTDKDAAMLESMLKFYDQFARQNDADVKLQKETARAHRRVGDIQRRLGQYSKAETAYRSALTTYQRLADATANNADSLTAMAAINNDLGAVYRNLGRFTEARDCHVEALETLRKEPAAAAAQPESRFELARTYGLLSPPIFSHRHGRAGGPPHTARHSPGPPLGRSEEAAENNRRALDILQKLTDEAPDNPRYRLAMARSQRDRCMIASLDGRVEEASHAKQQATEILEKLVADVPNNPDYRQELAETYAMRYSRPVAGTIDDATLKPLRRAVEIGTELVARQPTVPEYRASLSRWHLGMAEALRSTGSLVDAESQLVKAVQLQEGLAAEFPSVLSYRFFLARSLEQLAAAQNALHEPAKARTSMEKAIANFKKIQESTSGSPPPRMMLSMQYASLAKILRELGENAKADEADAQAKQLGGRDRHGHGMFKKQGIIGDGKAASPTP